MKARIIQNINGRWIRTEIDLADLEAAMGVLGFKLQGINSNPRSRAELQGQPTFSGLLGPMWDGDAIRYEDQASYNILSI